MVGPVGQFTEQEIFAQPRLWSEVLGEVAASAGDTRRLWAAAAAPAVVLTGCGSSYYLALTGAHLVTASLGIPCRALPSSEILFATGGFDGGAPPFAVGISRSGETTETVRALERLKDHGSATLAITCRDGGTLARTCHLAVALPVEEQSVVMTGSFTSMLLALAAVTYDLAGAAGRLEDLQRAPELGRRYIAALAEGAQAAGGAAQSFVYLGGGAMYGLANEGALKMTEMALLSSCAYHTLEYLHGPKAAISPGVLVVGLCSGQGRFYEERVLRHVAELGAAVVALGSTVDGLPSLDFSIEPGSVPAMLLAGMWTQLLALSVARRRGLDPDTPRFLEPVVTWDPV